MCQVVHLTKFFNVCLWLKSVSNINEKKWLLILVKTTPKLNGWMDWAEILWVCSLGYIVPYLLSFCVTAPKRLRQLNSNLLTTIPNKPLRLLKKYVSLRPAPLPSILLVLLKYSLSKILKLIKILITETFPLLSNNYKSL